MKSIHFKAIVVLVGYTLLTTLSLITGSLKSTPILTAYLTNILLSVFFGIVFLYFFSHEDFFKFAKELEKRNIKKEQSLMKHFIKYGKFFTIILIGLLTNPLITALAIRFMLPKFSYKYFLVTATSIAGAVAWLSIARGIIVLR